MTDAEIKTILAEAYRRLERMALSMSTAASHSPQTQHAILKSLHQLRDRLNEPNTMSEMARDIEMQITHPTIAAADKILEPAPSPPKDPTREH